MLVDIEQHHQLVDYLKAKGLLSPGDSPHCETLNGNFSQRLVFVSAPPQASWLIKQVPAPTRVEADRYPGAARTRREAEGLRSLGELLPSATFPRVVFEDSDQHILVVEADPPPYKSYQDVLLEEQPKTAHTPELASLLAELHNNSYQQKEQLSVLFADSAIFENLRLDPGYISAAHMVPEAIPFLFELIETTRIRKMTLVHGSFCPENILLSKRGFIVTNCETIHFGDPAFDVGFSLAHFLSTAQIQQLRRAELVDMASRYWHSYHELTARQRWAADLENFCVRHTLACMLALVTGTTALHYLDPHQKIAQKLVALDLIGRKTTAMADLLYRFPLFLKQYE